MTSLSFIETLQFAFDISVRGIIAQGGQSAHGNTCKYRTPSGRKCAIGHLIPDEVYDVSIDTGREGGYSLSGLKDEFPSLFSRSPLIDLDYFPFYDRLQKAHDWAVSWTHWKKGLEHVALAWGLNTTVLSEIPVDRTDWIAP